MVLKNGTVGFKFISDRFFRHNYACEECFKANPSDFRVDIYFCEKIVSFVICGLYFNKFSKNIVKKT